MKPHELKDRLFEQVARIGKATSSPKRLELLELLAQSEKSVDQLAREADINIKLASAHLKVLRESHLVKTHKEGRFVLYRLSGQDVASLWVTMRELAENHLAELSLAVKELTSEPDKLAAYDRQSLLQQAIRGEIIVLDVRPNEEYLSGHLPFARSIPLAELEQRIEELPKDFPIVAYCRGPFCLMSATAQGLLKTKGYSVQTLPDGICEWQAAGMPLHPHHTESHRVEIAQ
jgi:rhodanese-related sulfurtransferase/predicted transcriptional regulator